jgi:hypothetical protein
MFYHGARTAGIEKKQPFAWWLTRANNGTLYLIVSRRSDDESFGGADDRALYKSTYGAENWVRMKLPDGVNGPTGLSLDPENNSRVYLSAWGLPYANGIDGGSVWHGPAEGDPNATEDIVTPVRVER